MSDIATAFGDDRDLTYAHVADQVRALKPRTLTPHQLPDVITLVEFLQDDTTRRLDELEARETKLVERERAVTKRERDLATHQRAVTIILDRTKQKKWWQR